MASVQWGFGMSLVAGSGALSTTLLPCVHRGFLSVPEVR